MQIKHLTKRLVIIVPENRKPNTHTFKLRKAMIKAGMPVICAKCQSIDKVDAHHIAPVKYLTTAKGHTFQDPQGDHSASNGQFLCRSCHNKHHHSQQLPT